MKAIVLILLYTLLASAQEYKVVFDLTTGSETTLEKSLVKNVANLQKYYGDKGDTLKVAVVISGNSYKFFVEDLSNSPYSEDKALKNTFQKRKKFLTAFSKIADFEVCSMGMKKRNIKQSSLYPFVTPAFNKSEALIRYQSNGYSYILISDK